MKTLAVHQHPIELTPRCERVVLRPFWPSEDAHTKAIIERTLALSEGDAVAELASVTRLFDGRHREMERTLRSNYERAVAHIEPGSTLSDARKLLLGAQFCGEYALECAALFNPSIVPHPDQSHLPSGSLRFVLSLRSVGEGHISSIQFRQGTIDAAGTIEIEADSGYASVAIIRPKVRYKKKRVNYAIEFPHAIRLDERVIFPVTANESNGIEDARFVRFVDDDGSARYYATYTAFSARGISPQLIETEDFIHFTVLTLEGSAIKDKGMALFPRRIGGRYAMLSRQDNQNILIMFSSDPHSWSNAEVLVRPAAPWESVKIGNCGSPIETEAGWVVITHGVGRMRTYSLGAVLLDLDDPTQVIGRLSRPLITTDEADREGYVPNVVYSCGALQHGEHLILPYAKSDRTTTFVSIVMRDLLATMLDEGPGSATRRV